MRNITLSITKAFFQDFGRQNFGIRASFLKQRKYGMISVISVLALQLAEA
jgi:hypothetical protein